MSIWIRKDTLPWYQPQDGEEDHRFTEQALLMYVLLGFARDHYDEYNGSLKDLMSRVSGQIRYSRNDVVEYYGALAEIMERPAEYGDMLSIKASGRKFVCDEWGNQKQVWDYEASRRTPAPTEITPSKNLNLNVVVNVPVAEENVSFVVIDASQMQLLFGLTLKQFVNGFNLLMYLYSHMYVVPYSKYIAGEKFKQNGYGCWHRQKRICESLGIDDNTAIRHIMMLKGLGLLGYKPGSYGKDSIFTIGNNVELIHAVERRQNTSQRYQFGAVRGKYRDATEQTQWRTKVYASASQKT